MDGPDVSTAAPQPRLLGDRENAKRKPTRFLAISAAEGSAAIFILREGTMKELKERILKEGRVLPGDIIKVDGFLNHRVDCELMSHIADEFAK